MLRRADVLARRARTATSLLPVFAGELAAEAKPLPQCATYASAARLGLGRRGPPVDHYQRRQGLSCKSLSHVRPCVCRRCRDGALTCSRARAARRDRRSDSTRSDPQPCRGRRPRTDSATHDHRGDQRPLRCRTCDPPGPPSSSDILRCDTSRLRSWPPAEPNRTPDAVPSGDCASCWFSPAGGAAVRAGTVPHGAIVPVDADRRAGGGPA